MGQIVRGLIVIVGILLLAGLGYWGYSQYQAKQAADFDNEFYGHRSLHTE